MTSRAYNSWGIADTLSWSKGRHFMKFGIDLRGNQLNKRPQGNLAGTFNFTAAQTGIPGVNFVGHSFASFLLGERQQRQRRSAISFRWAHLLLRRIRPGRFQAEPKMDAELGLRYEFQPPDDRSCDRTSNFDLEVTIRSPA